MQYLVSVIDDTAGSRHPGGDGLPSARSTNGSSAEGTGSSPAAWRRRARRQSSTTGVGQALFSDGPFVESKEYLAGVWVWRGPRSGRGAQTRDRGVQGLQSEGRGTAVRAVSDVEEAITRAHREEWARVVASLTRRFGDLDVAEEAAAEAFATAVARWPADGVPPNPGAWLTTTANGKAIDRIRRESKRDRQAEGGSAVVRRRPARYRWAPSTTSGSG